MSQFISLPILASLRASKKSSGSDAPDLVREAAVAEQAKREAREAQLRVATPLPFWSPLS